MTTLKPIGDRFLFQFMNEHRDGKFIEKSKFGFILTNQNLEAQTDRARWGKVVAIGPDVVDFAVGDLVLIEYGQWTTRVTFEKTDYWKSDQSKVIAIGNDEEVVYSC